MADESTSTPRRIELRRAVNAANSELKAAVAECEPHIEAIKDEIENQRHISGRRQAIENAWCASLPDEVEDRLCILRKTQMAMDAVEFAWKNNLESASLSLNNEKERLAKEGRAKFHMSDLEKRERLACGVHRIISGWVHSLQDEIEAIRAARLAELYQK